MKQSCFKPGTNVTRMPSLAHAGVCGLHPTFWGRANEEPKGPNVTGTSPTTNGMFYSDVPKRETCLSSDGVTESISYNWMKEVVSKYGLAERRINAKGGSHTRHVQSLLLLLPPSFQQSWLN